MDARPYFCLFIYLLLTYIEAHPICSHESSGQVICQPGNYSQVILKRGIISDNNTTKSIILSNCRISDVDYESFHRLPALTYLDLSHNMITTLKLGVLDGFKELSHLDLSFNYLTTFPLGLFDQKPNLIHLDISSNKIDKLELGIFDPLRKLEYLDLSGNSLKGADINPYLFDRSKKISSLNFSRMDMRNAADKLLSALSLLKTIHLEECNLEDFPNFILKGNLRMLQKLNLSGNNIKKLKNVSLESLTSLITLNLTSNTIEEIDENVLKPLIKLKVIVLRNNKISTIPETLFQNMQVTNIDLSQNMIEYVPVNAFRGSKVRNLNISNNRVTFLQNNFCLELKNSGAVLVKFYFNENPWQCACLNDILSEVKKYNLVYNAGKYDGKHPICIVTDDFHCHRHKEYNQNVYNLYYEEK